MSADAIVPCPRCVRRGDDGETFRENWEIGLMGDGTNQMILKYSGECWTCGLSFEIPETISAPWTEAELNS